MSGILDDKQWRWNCILVLYNMVVIKEPMKTYVDNVKEDIRRQMLWAQDHSDYDPYLFIEAIDEYLDKMWEQGGPKRKRNKTRHG